MGTQYSIGNTKKALALLIVLLLAFSIFTFVDGIAKQDIDIYSVLPSPYGLASGMYYMPQGYSFVYNNGNLAVYYKDKVNIFVFNGSSWTEKSVYTNVETGNFIRSYVVRTVNDGQKIVKKGYEKNLKSLLCNVGLFTCSSSSFKVYMLENNGYICDYDKFFVKSVAKLSGGRSPPFKAFSDSVYITADTGDRLPLYLYL